MRSYCIFNKTSFDLEKRMVKIWVDLSIVQLVVEWNKWNKYIDVVRQKRKC